MNTTQQLRRTVGAGVLALALSACGESLSLDAAGNLAMTLQRAEAPLFGGFPAPSNETEQRSVQPDTVSSFRVTVTAVQYLRAGSDTSGPAGWNTLYLRAPVTVDLMALPSTSDSAQVFASGQIEAGSYTRVRLVVTNPRIRFKGAISFGIGGILQGGVDYGVALASAQNGIEAAANVTVESSASGGESSSVHLVFDENASLGTVSVTGSGTVQLSAVIRER